MDFQWYPGHMTKAKRMMQENMKLIDIMIELVDARIPLSSRNPDIDQLAANKSRLILLNKTDMADERVTAQWEEYFKEKGFYVARTNARSGKGVKGMVYARVEADGNVKSSVDKFYAQEVLQESEASVLLLLPAQLPSGSFR